MSCLQNLEKILKMRLVMRVAGTDEGPLPSRLEHFPVTWNRPLPRPTIRYCGYAWGGWAGEWAGAGST